VSEAGAGPLDPDTLKTYLQTSILKISASSRGKTLAVL